MLSNQDLVSNNLHQNRPIWRCSLDDYIVWAIGLGEALFKAADKSAAVPFFEKALVLKPDLDVARDYLKACG